MRRCQKVFLTLSILLLSAFLPAAVANGQGIPSLPNTFYGEVIVNGASPGRDDLTLTAVVDGDKHYSRPVAADGIYGGPRYPAPQLRVGGDVEDVDLDGKLIRFFVTVGAYSPTTNPGVETNENETFDQAQILPRQLDLHVTLAYLTVTKEVINDNEGTAGAGDFTLRIDGRLVVSGSASVVTEGTHTVSEDDPGPGYTSTIGGDCASDGTINVAAGDDASCTINNDDVSTAVSPPAPPPQITTTGGNGNGGGGAGGVAPTATPTPTPTLAPSGPDLPAPATATPGVVTPVEPPAVPPVELPLIPAVVPPVEPTAAPPVVASPLELPVVPVEPPVTPVEPPIAPEDPSESPPWWAWLLVALLILAAGGGGFYYWRMRNRLVV